MIQLYDQETGRLIGELTEKQLRYLIDQLEEEDQEDRDYYIDRATLNWFEEHGSDPALTSLLGEALGSREGMDIRWKRD